MSKQPDHKTSFTVADLFSAIKGQNYENVEKILKSGISPNAVHNNVSAIEYAVLNNKTRATGKALDLLVEAGGNLNEIGLVAQFFIAVRQNNLDALKRLIERGVDVNSVDGWNDIALTECAYHGWNEMIDLLIQSGADVNKQGLYGETAIYRASMHGQTATVKLLLNAGANPNIRDSEGISPLGRAKQFHRTDTIAILEQARAVL